MDHEILAMWVQTLSSVVGLGCIVWGLFSMKAAGHRRDREIDELGKGLQQQGQALERQGEMMTEALQGLRQQGQALERQGTVLAEALQGLTQQGRALEELLRRTA